MGCLPSLLRFGTCQKPLSIETEARPVDVCKRRQLGRERACSFLLSPPVDTQTASENRRHIRFTCALTIALYPHTQGRTPRVPLVRVHQRLGLTSDMLFISATDAPTAETTARSQVDECVTVTIKIVSDSSVLIRKHIGDTSWAS